MEKYVDYLRCGEIYKSPSHSNKTPYILKCYQCSDIFLLLESFIFHIEDYCKPFQDEEDVITPNSIEPAQEIQNNCDVDDALVVVKNEPVLDIDFEENLMVEDSGGGDTNNSSKCDLALEDGKVGQMADGGSSTDDADEGNDDLEEVFEIDDESDSEDDTTTSGDNTLPLFVTNFMKSRSNVIDLITAYKKQLHDKGLKGHEGLIEHKQYDFQKLTEQLNNKSKLNMTREQVAVIIKYLHREYREYLKSLCNNDKSPDNKSCWYFQYLDFLDHPPKESNIYQIDNHRSYLSHELILKILDVYKGFPHLWDTNLAEYCCKNIRHQAQEEMLGTLDAQLNLKVTQSSLKNYLRCIHNYFQKEKWRRLNHENTELMASDLLYKKMLFLADHVGPFICSDCHLEIKCPFMLKIHKFGIHGGDLPFNCSVCEKQFRSLNSYVLHAKRHMHDLNIECKLCNRKFAHHSGLKAHMATHSESRTSNSCESESTARLRTRQEKLSPSVNSRGANVVNIVSNRRYKMVTKYSSHTATTPTPANKCTVCGVLFKMKKSFNQHMKIHENNSNET